MKGTIPRQTKNVSLASLAEVIIGLDSTLQTIIVGAMSIRGFWDPRVYIVTVLTTFTFLSSLDFFGLSPAVGSDDSRGDIVHQPSANYPSRTIPLLLLGKWRSGVQTLSIVPNDNLVLNRHS